MITLIKIVPAFSQAFDFRTLVLRKSQAMGGVPRPRLDLQIVIAWGP